jgi:hypothetical protein
LEARACRATRGGAAIQSQSSPLRVTTKPPREATQAHAATWP